MTQKKTHRCEECTKSFATNGSLKQHMRDAHGTHLSEFGPMTKEGAKAVLESMDDLSDGAFWQMAADLGLEPEDIAEMGENANNAKNNQGD